MKSFKNISKHKQTIGICFGIIAAIVILMSQSFYYDYLANASQEATVEVSDEGNEQPDILTISNDAVTSVVQFTIAHVLHFIAELYLDNTDEIEVEVVGKIEANSYFKTLFRRIISPNAP